ncbi:YaeQ family protein [Thalassotalea sp. 1_MG-2023]|uniref:YaeQ family protein n=1 Tax=Thalassotalea sp. 1_MG-2023 TaxID=3062680 RepID=UPI0026E230B6|nr:YaeQ family protein [Thalassotalea sp. 1_MG-2023]MDO6428272.1 YaeQ family protein [Thalassotalea sp. 1_MG-2023]
MALKSTIYKTTIHLSDMDRNYYDTLNLTIARHPSETLIRMGARILAYVLNADPALTFGKGVSDEDEPVLWQQTLTEDITLWVELGQPDEKRVKRASNKADKVIIYGYHSPFDVWWQQQEKKLTLFKNVQITRFDYQALAKFSELIDRTTEIQASIQDGQLWLTIGDKSLLIEHQTLQTSRT